MRASRGRLLRIHILGSCGVFRLTQLYAGKKLIYMEQGGPQSRRGDVEKKIFSFAGNLTRIPCSALESCSHWLQEINL